VTMKPEMYLKMMESWKLTEGAYVLEKTKQNEFENI
jgi:hypothetical protein